MTRSIRQLAAGFHHAEALRWREGRLWFSDVWGAGVMSVSLDGDVATELVVGYDRTESIGWMPDGDLLVVSMDRRRLLRRRAQDGMLHVHADLSDVAGGPCNGMVIDRLGRAYVSTFGFDLEQQILTRGRASVMAKHPMSDLILVRPDGSSEIAAAGLDILVNAAVIAPDEKTLVVAETYGRRLTAFDIDADGRLSNRRQWAPLGHHLVDGICMDAEGAIWVSTMMGDVFLRVAEGGKVLDRIDTPVPGAWGCMLGGPAGKTLFFSTNTSTSPPIAEFATNSQIWMVDVDVPHGGRP